MRFQLYQFYNEPTINGQRKKIMVGMLVTGATTFVLAGLAAGCYVIRRQRSNGTQKDEERSQRALLHELVNPPSVAINQEGNIWKDNKQNVSGDELGRFSSVVNDTLHNLSRLAAFNPSYGRFSSVVNDTLHNLSRLAAFNPSPRYGNYGMKERVGNDRSIIDDLVILTSS
ncbi:hypothetical protein LOK49_LG09G00410 [Camellia lanceoleosa]|uniref:Uncharacterized protein n=1 Tax=Camellia lanceoleosa TaxID=1840588 RepID=A0ACC0GLL0_9ERIC|nr:hypothetical protein LOK49_LG09G00410 [Camellia lanceoleosa]